MNTQKLGKAFGIVAVLLGLLIIAKDPFDLPYVLLGYGVIVLGFIRFLLSYPERKEDG